MFDDIFFKENLYIFLLRNDSMFKKFETDSILIYSYIISKELLMNINFKINYELYLKFRKSHKYKIFESIEDYFKLIEDFLKYAKVKESYFLYENGKIIDITKIKMNRYSMFKVSNAYKKEKIRQLFDKKIDVNKSLINIFEEIINAINNDTSEDYHIIVENYDEYLFLTNLIYKSNIKVKFKEYKYFKDCEIYQKILRYLSKNEYDKVKLRKMIVNTSDYYEHFFNNFILNMIKDLDDKNQFLFYMYLYKDFYLVRKHNEDSNIEIEPLEHVTIRESKNYMILTSENIKLKEGELMYHLERLIYLEDIFKFYKYEKTKDKKCNNFNILNTINSDKN